MPPRVPISRLPRLTLFTGGPECGLCEVSRELRNADHANFQVALDYLDLVYETHPFDLELFNIRDPPKEADPMEANKWKRMYQYDIPVLHLEGKEVQRNKINTPELKKILEDWQAQRREEQQASK
ncbi:hypothetical protein A1Q2_03495 [Trichosporon asahii var. asahii CBS 8904]|uniref:Glutaredoxin-like protein n=2 Tax=Trichosporon asahii var. asahii TaxID=189963 RepID=K1VZF8_TRIAC|nr:hypothetical protein A1Q1_08062 [Trichosporon asahii var. asahii CBS 2479]EJT53145.1 hypothetical protein A1Q1_08062 [Trichosporon asahii var. asahii CBS 2479]EKD02133.1 hypothetical protein A1Q2_03495 [Trichosporon asahii var. asahii CBS 8904]